MIQNYSYALDSGSGFERAYVSWTWAQLEDWMTPIPNTPSIPGSEDWIYRILNGENTVFEGTQSEFLEKYL
jgi:hypothetical protein